MPTRLSALTYIRNNKRRSAVFIVSLSLFITTLYLMSYMLSSTTTSFYKLLVEQTKMTQIIIPKFISKTMNREAQLEELAFKLNQVECVKKAIPAKFISPYMTAIFGQYSIDSPLVEKGKLEELLRYNKAELIEGRMPESPGEVLVDELYAKNQELQIGSNLLTDSYIICGIVQCDNYFISGIPAGIENVSGIYIYSDGENIDFKEIYQSLNLPYDYNNIWDNVMGKEEFRQSVSSTLDFSSNIITYISTILLAVCLFVVYNLYVRNRYEEWCLYASIGYSAGDIYKLSLREMLFTYGIALTAASSFSLLGVIVIKNFMIDPMGLLSTPIMTETIGSMACILVTLFGIFQIPVLTALQRIKTIDSIEEDEW